MTADISSFTMPCGASQTCRHEICKHCGNMIRTGWNGVDALDRISRRLHAEGHHLFTLSILDSKEVQ